MKMCANGLLPLDDELADELDRLVALRSECLALVRVEPCLRLLHARKLRYADTLRRRAEHSDDPITGDKIASGLLDRLVNRRVVGLKCSAIEDFALGDEIHLLDLSVKALNCCGTKGGTCDH